MAWVTPSSVSTGDVLQAAQWNQDIVANMAELAPFSAAWTTFTPTFAAGWVPTFTFSYAKYCKVGKFVTFGIHAIWSSAGAGSGLNINFPVTAANAAAAASLRCYILDSGTANIAAQVTAGSTTTFSITSIRTDGTYGTSEGLSNTTPMTWAANDAFWVGGTYEAA